MRCSQAIQQLQLYIDAQLPWEKRYLLERHLTECAACGRELAELEEIASILESTELVLEPADLTENIMRRVAQDVQKKNAKQEAMSHERYIPLRPSLKESLSAIALATIAMFGILLEQPGLRASTPFSAPLSRFATIIAAIIQPLVSMNNGTVNALAWVLGTLLGVCITLILVGNDIREEWFNAISHKLPVR